MKVKASAIVAVAVVMLLIGMLIVPIAVMVQGQGAGSVTRSMPAEASCGDTVVVTLTVDPPAGTTSWIIDEGPPASVTEVFDVDSSNNGEYMEDSHRVKWLSLSGGAAVLSYSISVPLDTPDGATLLFHGEYRFNPSMDDRAAISGADAIVITCDADPTGGGGGGGGGDADPSDDTNDNETETGDPADPDAGSVVRALPTSVLCGETFLVRLSVAVAPGTTSWIIDEVPPAGAVSSVDPDNLGEYINENHRVKWFSTDGKSANHTYELTVPAGTPHGTELAFSGEYRFHPVMDGRAEVTGDTKVDIECFEAGTVVRTLPSSVQCGTTFPVRLTVTPFETTTAWLLREHPPSGLQVSDVGGSLGNVTAGNVTWISTNGTAEVLSYNLTIPGGLAPTTLSFAGEYRFHSEMDEVLNITGHTDLTVTCPAASSGGGGGPSPPPENGSNGVLPPDEDPPDLIIVDGVSVPPPEGASSEFTVGPVTARGGDTLRLRFDDPNVPQIEILLADDLDAAMIRFVKWPGDAPPPGTGPIPGGVTVAYFIQVLGLGPGNEAVFSLSLDPDQVPPLPVNNAVILHFASATWNPVDTSGLVAENGRLVGSSTVACCSFFAVGFDVEPPIIEDLTVVVDAVNQTALIEAHVRDNLRVDRVAFSINGEHWRTLTQAPYIIELDVAGYQPGIHEVQVQAFDTSGWSDSSVQAFEVEEAIREPGGSGWIWMLLVLGVIVGAGIYLVKSGQGARLKERIGSGKGGQG